MINRSHRSTPLQIAWFRALLAICAVLSIESIIAKADSDNEPLGYTKSPAHDPVAKLQQRIDRGEVKFSYDPQHGFLESLLKYLKVPASSQGLVFSKTSFQHPLINPRKPRALYFNDDTYVGYVRNAPMLELAAMDPDLGTVFYVLKQEPAAKPKFIRQTYECTQCHDSGMTHDVPGLIMRSVYPDIDGQPIFSAGTYVSDDQSPIAERWGGWYVTGKCGRQRHMGNVTCDDEQHVDQTDFSSHASMTTLANLVNTDAYLRDSSDVVALMVLAHQTHVHNLMTVANYEVRAALRDSNAVNKALGLPLNQQSESTKHRIRNACEPLVKAMLFSGETKLIDPIQGTSGFAEEFSALGPRDSRGRSLRVFDLNHRLFKYPCSYLIYSDQFDGLPAEGKTYVYHRLWQVLTDRDETRPFAHLTDDDRDAIMQILVETKKDLPGYWRGRR